jgi:hypothetical protein
MFQTFQKHFLRSGIKTYEIPSIRNFQNISREDLIFNTIAKQIESDNNRQFWKLTEALSELKTNGNEMKKDMYEFKKDMNEMRDDIKDIKNEIKPLKSLYTAGFVAIPIVASILTGFVVWLVMQIDWKTLIEFYFNKK